MTSGETLRQGAIIVNIWLVGGILATEPFTKFLLFFGATAQFALYWKFAGLFKEADIISRGEDGHTE